MERSRTPNWQYAVVAILVLQFVFVSIQGSQIGVLPALVVSALAIMLIASIWTSGWRATSGFWKAVAGIAVAVIYACACYLITGHWPTKTGPM
jgi:hypothetical protein